MKTFRLHRTTFNSVKEYLDGFVFWRELPNGNIECKVAFASTYIDKLVSKIKVL